MARRVGVGIRATTELLDRWRAIEEEEEDDDGDHLQTHNIRTLKEAWFSDTFNFLVNLPKETHIWCGCWGLMGPLLETFFNYTKDGRGDSPLKLLWKRISEEMRQCTQCICQHHKAQEMYASEYESSSVGPLLNVLQSLDEERVTQHLQEMNLRITKGEYDPMRDHPEVVSVMFEVLMFPNLLDDQSLVTEFQIFIESIDNSHELTLAGHQQYPGVYALFFFKNRRTRLVGLRLAGNMGKLRRATDLDPLQPMLKKCIGFLETEIQPSVVETSRPRVQLERITVWLGIKTLLGFLEPPAFEEGILERYPVFLSIILNHISDDSLEFSHAVNCLRLLFEMLGCKLWLRATLSPSVMRNTLLGQCFHTRNEKIHKEIFDLFQPFLQSLEVLQDGEHEKQRRHFIYFLLHQVTVSSNFSVLMKKKASQIALLIIHRGYKMVPPCPPFECAHMWGPSLVSSLKDSSLHNSLRQPAFDLIQTIVVSDAAALITSVLNYQKTLCSKKSTASQFAYEDEDDNNLFANDAEEKSSNCWIEFNVQGELTSREIGDWMCIPMLWLDVLVEIDPTTLPVSFSKAVFWALSRFSMVEPENSSEIALPVRYWLSTCVSEVSHLFVWKVPSGSDDGAEGKELKNSVKISMMCNSLIKTFKRLTGYFIVKMEQGDLNKQWAWEPMMSESLILLLVDSNDNARQVGRRILEQISNTRGLVLGLQFLSSSFPSLCAVLSGLRHAIKLVKMDSVFLHFQTLHHFFFVICKLLREGVAFPRDSLNDLNMSKFSSQGGFLKQPIFDSVHATVDMHSKSVDLLHWEEFTCSVAITVWPFALKCLAEGKAFSDYTISQMTCVRLLEILPVLFERVCPLSSNFSTKSRMRSESYDDYKWLYDLMDWGRSSLVVIARYWKQTTVSLLGMLKQHCNEKSIAVIRTIEGLLSRDNVAVDDELTKQVSRLSVALSDRVSDSVEPFNAKSNSLAFDDLAPRKKLPAQDAQLSSSEDADVQILEPVVNKIRDAVIVLSDDEAQTEVPKNEDVLITHKRNECVLDDKAGASEGVVQGEVAIANIPTVEAANQVDSQKLDLETHRGRKTASSDVSAKLLSSVRINKKGVNGSFPFQNTSNIKSPSTPVSYRSKDNDAEKSNIDIKDLVRDTKDDRCELAVKAPKHQPSLSIKPNISVPKRQVIQLNLPEENRPGGLYRPEGGIKKLKPPRLDDWYRPILELDYFVAVGLASTSDAENRTVCKLKEVPLSFESPEQYVDIFRPLVLEEFKAQMYSSFQEMSSLEDMGCGCVSVLAVERVDDFHIVRCIHDDDDPSGNKSIAESDLILLTRQPLKNSSNDVHLVGKVERREKNFRKKTSMLVIRFYLQTGSPRLNRARKLLIERSKWYLNRIMSMTPQLREFQALSSINDNTIFPIILNPINHPSGLSKARKGDFGVLPQPMQHIFRSSYNDSQLQAIGTAVGSLDSNKGFSMSLIQGPPGTGKTRTILAIVSGLLAFSSQRIPDMRKPSNGILKPLNSLSSKSRPQFNPSAAIARAWQDAALARQLNEDTDKSCKSMRNRTRGRVLICAQSNAAVDELVSRISSEGLIGSDGTKYKPYIVRVGNAKTIHPNSLPVFIDTLVDQQLAQRDGTDAKNDENMDSSSTLRANLEKLVDQIRSYEAKRANLGDDISNVKGSLEGEASKGDVSKEMSHWEVDAKLKKLYAEKKTIYKDLANVQAREKKAYEESKALKHKLRRSILKEAEVVVTTLSGCGGDLYGVCCESVSSLKFSNSSEHALFDAVVIDEAAQALEPATLIPLQLLKSNGMRCIMVGDPKQLPATVLSNVANKYLYHCSMFERLQRAGHPVVMLKEQYRMHPEICHFPSIHFYDKQLLNGDQMASKKAPFHETKGLGPYVFFDVVDGLELHGKNYGGMSLYNECEADAAVEVLRGFKNMYPAEFIGGRIGVITPYKCQLSLLRSRFSSAFGSSFTAEMEFNTVDGFQGREVDILVLSTVRAAKTCSSTANTKSSNIGFVADVRRMNVALTRARLSLWILGSARTLNTNRNWAALVSDAKERDVIISLKKPYERLFKSAFKGSQATGMPDNCSKRPNNEGTMKGSSNPAERVQDKFQDFQERKKRFSSSGVHGDKKRARDADNLSKAKEKDRSVEKTKYDHRKKDPPPTSGDKARKFKHTQSETRSDVSKDDRSKEGRSIDGKLDRKKSNLGAKKVNFENPTSNADHADKRMKMVAGIPSQQNVQKFDGSDRGRTLDSVDGAKDAIVERKKKREAVDALLSSALISSRKMETSSKSLHGKRSLPSKPNSAHGIRPPKQRKEEPGREEEEEDDDVEQEEEEGDTSSSEWRDVEADARNIWYGFDALYKTYRKQMLFFNHPCAQQLEEIGSHGMPCTPPPRSGLKKLNSPFRCLSLKKMEEPDDETKQLQQPQYSP